MIVALSGPMLSLVLAIIFSYINCNLINKQDAVYSNILILLFNLLPIYPLDGGRILKYILPLGAFAVAIKMACIDDDGYISSKIGQYVLLLIFIAVILSVYQIYNGEINIEQNISEIVKDAYQLGENNIGGGALGTIAAFPLFK